LHHPVLVEATPENTTVDAIEQKVYRVAKELKTGLIIKLISEGNWQQVLVFTRTKHGANRLCKKMISSGITASAIHGNKGQGARTKALAGFKNGSVRVLVATDIAARGLDIPLLPHVVNFELPNIAEDYVHRIGRTGRAGASGEAISLVCGEEREYLRDIEKLVGLKIPVDIVEGFEPDTNAPSSPPKKKKQSSRHSRNTSAKKSKSPKSDAAKGDQSRRPKRNRNRNRNKNRRSNDNRN
jgi:ATP-dependent RNA helicase RhlE